LYSSADLYLIGERLDELSGENGSTAWINIIISGRQSLANYLTRVFTSPQYYSKAVDDTTFVQDSYYAVTGDKISSDNVQEALRLIQKSGSRFSWINLLVNDYELGGRLTEVSEPTQLRTFLLQENLPAAGQTIVGVQPISAEARLTGTGARIKLYSDNKLKQVQNINQLTPDDNQYTVYWDTRFETEGLHSLDYLVQTTDGRGKWISLNSYYVPEIIGLSPGMIISDNLDNSLETVNVSGNQNALWYRLDSEDNRPMVTLFDIEGELDFYMFNSYGLPKAETSSRGNSPAALRFEGSADDQYDNYSSYYIKAVRPASSADSPGDVSENKAAFRLVQAETVAQKAGGSEDWLAVLKREPESLLVYENDEAVWQPAEQFNVLELDSRLADFKILSSEGSDVLFAPAFNRETELFGLYVDTKTSELSFSASTIEGSAADIAVSLTTENGEVKSVLPETPFRLDPSVNNLQLIVTGFKGFEKIYQLQILKSPASDGYHEILEAFPFSYRTPLWAMHLQYPLWEFAADDTGVEWDDFLNAQDNKDKSLVDANYSPAGWVKPDSPVYDGASWKAASREVVAYFADPRHALQPIDIFQFESLQFEPELHSAAGVEAVLEGSFMSEKVQQEIDYAGLIYDAGRVAGISPYFLAAKIIQEMGIEGQSMLAHGSLPGFEGVYNFYNIGSTPDPEIENGALINGAKFALYGRNPEEAIIDEDEADWLLPWDSREKAITGGAIWIARGYIAIGQDTLYGQKFDLVADPDLFIHQYAQNIQMAWAEGRRTYRSYESMQLLNQPFVFKIPYFRNMPEKLPVWPD
jgi:beta-N-acetylglucosaminidase